MVDIPFLDIPEDPTALTRFPSLKPKKSQAQLNCEAKGGRWDEATQTCILPEPPVTPAPTLDTKPPVVLPDVVEVGETVNAPKQTATLPDGRTFFGLSPDEIALLAQQEQGRALPEGTAPAGTAAQAAAIEQERQRLIAEETPVRRELDPTSGFLEGLPIVGGIIGLGRTLIGEPMKKALGIESKQGLELRPEVMRTAALTEIERQEIERGLTFNEKFGAFVEAIPVVGSLASQYAGGLIETPSENAKQVKTNILKERRRITNIETNVKLGYLPVSVAREQIRDINENVQRLESRIRLLVNHSPELKFNSDYVNTVETEILATREKAFQAQQNILTGATQDPTEIQILQQLQSLQGDVEL